MTPRLADTSEPALADKPPRLPLRVRPDEVPPELADNPIVRFLVEMSPEDEALLEHLFEADRRDPFPT